MENFLRGQVGAFAAWGGVPRTLLYDNLKSAVLERQGQAIRFNPVLLGFAGHHRYEPRPVAVARGNEKGRVERAIRYIRDNFFAGRTLPVWMTLPRLKPGCTGPTADWRCPAKHHDADCPRSFRPETKHLLTCPENSYPTESRWSGASRSTRHRYARFDLNTTQCLMTMYSAP